MSSDFKLKCPHASCDELISMNIFFITTSSTLDNLLLTGVKKFYIENY